MALFGGSREIVFDAGSRSRRSTVPGWLILVSIGILIGVIGVLWAQQRFGPVQLTVAESRQLIQQRDQALAEQKRLEAAALSDRLAAEKRLQDATSELETARSGLAKRNDDLAKAEESIGKLRRDIELYTEVMPPDPRDNPIGVRAARMERDHGNLSYHVLLTRGDGATGKPFAGVMQLEVRGQRATGAVDSIMLGPVPIRVGDYQHVKGSLALPKGFDARQTSIRVLDKPEGNSYGMRIINVQ